MTATTTEQQTLKGTIQKVIHYTEDSGYTVAQLKLENLQNLKIVGVMPRLSSNESVEVTGIMEQTEKWGSQFKVTQCAINIPTDIEGFERYLASGVIRGVRHGMAKTLVQHFGTDIKDVLDKTPERLLEVHGISQNKMEIIAESWKAKTEARGIFMFLHSMGLTANMADKIYKHYKEKTIEKLKENPYRLADEIWGIGFSKADTFALKMGIKPNDPFRIKAGALYTLTEATNQGHTYIPATELVIRVQKALRADVSDGDVAKAIKLLHDKGAVVGSNILLEGKATLVVYPTDLYEAEVAVSNWFGELAVDRADSRDMGSAENILLDIKSLEAEQNITLSDEQRQAVLRTVTNKTTILTGFPGSGKTVISNIIIGYFESKGMRVLLAAPTGRAAKRLSEVSGRRASTLHRLLEYSYEDPRNPFIKNQTNPLDCDVLLLDEVSMVDLWLFHQVIKALPKDAHFVMVGDDNQLPSVRAGAVLKDLIATNKVIVNRLTQVFRQDSSNLIAMNAVNINKGLPLMLPSTPEETAKSDFIFLERTENANILDTVLKLVTEILPRKGVDLNDIQILTPQKKGDLGTYLINKRVQEISNAQSDDKAELLIGGDAVFRVGDRVMQVRNNYGKDVFNGDIGYIKSIDEEDQVFLVEYPDKIVSYKRDEVDELILAYAQTIHKSQGGEYPIVVMVMTTSHHIMLYRNLFYTGVTRGKRLVILVGNDKAIRRAILNDSQQARYSHLSNRINKYVEKAGL